MRLDVARSDGTVECLKINAAHLTQVPFELLDLLDQTGAALDALMRAKACRVLVV